jgi:hypothetical protein
MIMSIDTGFRDKNIRGVIFEPRLADLQLLGIINQQCLSTFKNHICVFFEKRRGVHHCMSLHQLSAQQAPLPAQPSHAPLRPSRIVRSDTSTDTQPTGPARRASSFEATHLQTRNPARHATHWASQTRLFVRSDTSTVSHH